MANFPQQFIENIQSILADESAEFFEALDSQVATSIRFNPYKLAERPEGEQVPWCRYGYMLSERPQFTLDPLFHSGMYYVQESSSMFVEHLLRSCFDSVEGLRVLDLCAAPGGKTTLYSTLVGMQGLVVANEVIRQRAMTLADNSRKWGLANIAVTNNDPTHFEGLEHFFDVVAVDAPCSGEGMFRKNPNAREEWSLENVNLCAQRQRRILSDIWGSLKPGGVLIYSTCTFNHTENEDNLRWLINEFECEAVDVDVDPSWNIVKGDVDGVNTFRFYPHRVKGEGFFATVVRKPEGRVHTRVPKPRKQIFYPLTKQELVAASKVVAQPDQMDFLKVGDNVYGYYSTTFRDLRAVAESLTVIASGVVLGQFFGNKLKPDHSLAMFHDLNREEFTQVDLDLDDALRYLRKQDIDPSDMAEGINLVCFESAPLGWIKRIGTRTNNLYPKELRILM